MTLLILSLYFMITVCLALRLSKKLDFLKDGDRMLITLLMAPALPFILVIDILGAIILASWKTIRG